MSAYYILQISVKDPVKLGAYTSAAPATVQKYKGELVFRGKVSEIVAGQPNFTSAVVIQFPDEAYAKQWYESAEYQSLINIRDEAADVTATRFSEADFF